MEKKCPTCKETLPVNYFWSNKHKHDGLGSECKTCQKLRINKWRKTDAGKESRRKEYKRACDIGITLKTRLKNRYGITVDTFNKMFEGQNGLCAICDSPLEYLKANVDHNHRTGKVRGLLCGRCNTMLAAFDDMKFFDRAVEYILTNG